MAGQNLSYAITLKAVGADTIGSVFRSMEEQSKELGSSFRNLSRIMGDTSAVDRLRQKMDGLNRELSEGTRPNNEVQREIEQTRRALERAERTVQNYGIDLNNLTGELQRMGRASELASKRLSLVNKRQELSSRRSALMGEAMSTAGAVMSAALPIKKAIEYESAVADLGKVFDGTSEQLKAYQAQALQVSEASGLAATDVVGLYASLSQGGIAADELGAVAQTAIEMSVAFDGLDPTAAGEVMANWRNAMGLTNDQAKELAGTVNFLSDTTAASSGNMVKVVSRLGGAAKQAGLSPKETAAFAAQVLSAGVNAETASTSLGKLFSTLTLGGSMSGKAQEALAGLGFDSQALSKMMQENASGTILTVLDAISKVAPERRVSVMSDIFGTDAEMRTTVAALVGNLGAAARTIESVSDGTSHAASLTAEYERRQQTTAQTLKRLRASVTNLGISFGILLLPTISSVADIMSSMAKRMRAFAERFPGVTKAVGLMATSMVALKFAMFGMRLVGLVASSSILAVRSAALSVTTALPNLIGRLSSLRNLRLATIFAPLTPVLGGLGTALLPVVGIALLLGGALVLLWKNFDYVSSFAQGFWSVISDKLSPAIDGFKEKLGFLKPVFSFIGNLFKKTEYSADELSGAFDSGASFAESLGNFLWDLTLPLRAVWELTKWVGDSIGWLAAQIGMLVDRISTATGPLGKLLSFVGEYNGISLAYKGIKGIGSLFGGDEESQSVAGKAGSNVLPLPGLSNKASNISPLPGISSPGSNIVNFPMAPRGAGDTAMPMLPAASSVNSVTDNSKTEITVNVNGGTNGVSPEAIARAISAEQDKRSRTRMVD